MATYERDNESVIASVRRHVSGNIFNVSPYEKRQRRCVDDGDDIGDIDLPGGDAGYLLAASSVVFQEGLAIRAQDLTEAFIRAYTDSRQDFHMHTGKRFEDRQALRREGHFLFEIATEVPLDESVIDCGHLNAAAKTPTARQYNTDPMYVRELLVRLGQELPTDLVKVANLDREHKAETVISLVGQTGDAERTTLRHRGRDGGQHFVSTPEVAHKFLGEIIYPKLPKTLRNQISLDQIEEQRNKQTEAVLINLASGLPNVAVNARNYFDIQMNGRIGVSN